MDTEGLLLDRVREFLLTERLSVIVGVLVLAAAAGVGVVMGGPLPLGLVGAAIVVAAFVWMFRRNRQERVVGATLGGVVAHFALVTVVVLVIIQLVPYGRSHSNPPVVAEPDWSSAQTRELMVNACFGCHSNEVEWPWYSNIAPISWVVTAHVDEGREKVNYSEFTDAREDGDETIEVILDGEMPPSYYTAFGLHPEAKLTEQEIADLVAGLRLTPGMGEGEGHGDESGGDDDDDDDDHDDDD